MDNKRLKLLPTNWADWQEGKRLNRLPEPLEFTDYDAPYDSFNWSYIKFTQELSKGHYDVLSIWHETDLIGFVKAFEFTHNTCECGIEILEPENYGKGYATEAMGLFIHYLKTNYQLKSMTGLMHPKNKRSIGLFKKLGFKHLGQFQDPLVPEMVFEKYVYTFIKKL